jgi:hypothetical protein
MIKMGKYVVSLLGLIAILGVSLPASADWELHSLATNRCLGVKSASKTSGAQVVTFDCDNTLNQRWNQVAFWPNPNAMFSHLTSRVLEQLPNPQTGNRCLGLSGTAAVSVTCNLNAQDPNSVGWWIDYIGDRTIGGVVRNCVSLRSKTSTSNKYLTSSGANLNQPTIQSQVEIPLGATQIWCIVPK